jgi:hypothetical protein
MLEPPQQQHDVGKERKQQEAAGAFFTFLFFVFRVFLLFQRHGVVLQVYKGLCACVYACVRPIMLSISKSM